MSIEGRTDTTIDTIIFDLGRVLISFYPIPYFKTLGYSEEKAHFLHDTLIGHKAWVEMDRGTHNYADLEHIYKKLFPELSEDIERIMNESFLDILTVIEDSERLLRELKALGYKLYILSNFSYDGFELVQGKYEFFKLFDGGVVSSHVKMVKPNEDVYLELLRKYSLQPERCVFLDDLTANIETARRLGINGIVFTTADKAREELKKLGVL